MSSKSWQFGIALVIVFASYSFPVQAEQTACSDAEPHCISNQFQTSVVRQALVLDPVMPPNEEGFPIEIDGPVPKGVAVTVDTDGNGFVDQVDLDGDGIIDFDDISNENGNVDATTSADLDNDGNIDVGPGGDGTIFVDVNLNGAADFDVDWVVSVDPDTGAVTNVSRYWPDDPSIPQPVVAGNIKNVKLFAHVKSWQDNKNNEHSLASSPEQNGDNTTADEASNAFSGPRPRCPDDYHGNGNSGGDGGPVGGGRPGRQSDGGGGRP